MVFLYLILSIIVDELYYSIVLYTISSVAHAWPKVNFWSVIIWLVASNMGSITEAVKGMSSLKLGSVCCAGTQPSVSHTLIYL